MPGERGDYPQNAVGILVTEGQLDSAGVLDVAGLGDLLMNVRATGVAQVIIYLEAGWADEPSAMDIRQVLSDFFKAVAIRGEQFMVECQPALPTVCVCTVWCQEGAALAIH